MARAKRGSVVAVCGGAELAAIVERGLGFRIALVYCLGWAGLACGPSENGSF